MDEKKNIKEHRPEERDWVDQPFEPQRGGWVEWIYDHRRGLLVTAALYLLLAVGFVTAKISLKGKETEQAIYIDMPPLEQLIEQKELLEKKVKDLQALQRMEQEYNESVRNAVSNADGELNSGLKDAKGTNASDIYNEAQAVQDKMRASREAYEQGLKDANAILNDRPASQTGSGETATRGKQSGKVSVSYYLPGRNDRNLPVPAYQCPGGGTVVVKIEVNPNGSVIAAAIDSAGSSADPCLREYALKAAQKSLFDVDTSAANRQPGTITYEFTAQ